MYDRATNVRSKRFSQKSLQSNLSNIVAGQSLINWNKAIIITILFFLIAGFLAGFLGALASLQIGIGTDGKLEYLLMILVVSIVLINAIYQSLNRITLIGILSIILAVIVPVLIYYLVYHLGILQNPKLFLPNLFLPKALFIILFGLLISIISFLLFCFALALSNVLINRFQLVKTFGILIMILIASVLGSIIEISFELQQTKFKENLSSFNLQIVIILGGIAFGSYIAGSAWLSNRFRNIPLNRQNLLSLWALAFGSWGGTSFYNLDLSRVNFRNAKLANTDLRARKLYRTCFQGVTGLERSRVDSRYMDLEIPKVQKLLTQGHSEDPDFSGLNLRGAYLQDADLRRMNFIDTNLTSADLRGADLRASILANAQVIDVDFTDANLTGICILNWNVNSQTCFTNVECDYIYRRLDDKGEPSDRFPADRNFNPREFESLYQEVGNVVELVFREGVNWRAFAFTMQKLQLEDEGLGLEIKGVEKRGDLWVVKVTHNENVSTHEVETRLNSAYEQLQQLLATKEQQINRLLGIVENQTEAFKEISKRFGNNFWITGSSITNLAGSGQIEYDEAAVQVRNIVASSADSGQATAILQNFLAKLQRQSVAATEETQAELMQQMILAEAEKDLVLKQFLIQQEQQIIAAFPQGILATAIQNAIAQLR